LGDGLDDSAEQLVVVDNVEKMKCKEVAFEDDASDRHAKKHLRQSRRIFKRIVRMQRQNSAHSKQADITVYSMVAQ